MVDHTTQFESVEETPAMLLLLERLCKEAEAAHMNVNRASNFADRLLGPEPVTSPTGEDVRDVGEAFLGRASEAWRDIKASNLRMAEVLARLDESL